MNYQPQFCHSESIQFDDSINGFQDSLQLQQCFEKFQDESVNSPLQPIQQFNGLIFESENSNELNELEDHSDKEKAYYCEVENCQKPFKAYCLLKDHMRMHQLSVPFQKVCLNSQIISQQNKEKPFQCNYCQQSFSQNSNLKRHLRIHTNEKPFVCSMCDKAFNTTSNLKQHQQIHLNERERKQFKCDIDGCSKFYFYASNLKKHRQAHEMSKRKALVKQLNGFNSSCKVEPQEITSCSYNGIYNYNNPIIVLNNGQLFLLINSLLYNLNGEDTFGHELQISDQNPFKEHECNPLQEITHWSSFDEVKQLYTKIENELKLNGSNITYQMLINKNNCNSLWCTCHTMSEHNNWQNCVNNPLKYQFSSSLHQSTQQLSSSNSVSPSQSVDMQMAPANGLCLCKETEPFKHQHNNHCGHPAIRHAGHIDYLVGNILHYQHSGHCDSHGSIQLCDLSKISAKEMESVKILESKITNTV